MMLLPVVMRNSISFFSEEKRKLGQTHRGYLDGTTATKVVRAAFAGVARLDDIRSVDRSDPVDGCSWDPGRIGLGTRRDSTDRYGVRHFRDRGRIGRRPIAQQATVSSLIVK